MLTDNIVLILASLGLFQGILLFIYLVTLKSGNRQLNIYLGLILLGLTIRIGKSIFGYYTVLEAWQMNIGISGILFVGPLLWFYGLILFQKIKKLPKTNYIHLVPFVLFISSLSIVPSNGDFKYYWNYGLIVFHLGIYLMISWLLLWRCTSKRLEIEFKWYKSILIGVTLVWTYYLSNFLNLKLHYISGPIFYSFLIYAFTYLFMNRNNIHLRKYESSNLDQDNSLALFNKIKELLESEKIFLDSSASLQVISDKLSKSPRVISQAINENTQQNFKEFINQYRIQNAQIQLMDLKNKNKKIATIAYDSGFGTVTAFNVAFKKNTGQSPTDYRKENV